jgi:hypothetical protein
MALKIRLGAKLFTKTFALNIAILYHEIWDAYCSGDASKMEKHLSCFLCFGSFLSQCPDEQCDESAPVD